MAASSLPPLLNVFFDDTIEEVIEAPKRGVQSPLHPRQSAHPLQGGDEIADGEASEEHLVLEQHLLEAAPSVLAALHELAPEGGAAKHAVGVHGEHLAEVHLAAAAEADAGEHEVDLGGAARGEGVDAAGAEELEDAELADAAPVGAVGGEGDVGRAVEELLGGVDRGA